MAEKEQAVGALFGLGFIGVILYFILYLCGLLFGTIYLLRIAISTLFLSPSLLLWFYFSSAFSFDLSLTGQWVCGLLFGTMFFFLLSIPIMIYGRTEFAFGAYICSTLLIFGLYLFDYSIPISEKYLDFYFPNRAELLVDDEVTSSGESTVENTQTQSQARLKIINAIRNGGGNCDRYSSISRSDKTLEIYNIKCKNGSIHTIEFNPDRDNWNYKGELSNPKQEVSSYNKRKAKSTKKSNSKTKPTNTFKSNKGHSNKEEAVEGDEGLSTKKSNSKTKPTNTFKSNKGHSNKSNLNEKISSVIRRIGYNKEEVVEGDEGLVKIFRNGNGRIEAICCRLKGQPKSLYFLRNKQLLAVQENSCNMIADGVKPLKSNKRAYKYCRTWLDE